MFFLIGLPYSRQTQAYYESATHPVANLSFNSIIQTGNHRRMNSLLAIVRLS